MLDLDDDRWKTLTAGYRIPVDLRPLLARLESGRDRAAVWHDLWDTLHHQGDVGVGSFVAVPHIVRILELEQLAIEGRPRGSRATEGSVRVSGLAMPAVC